MARRGPEEPEWLDRDEPPADPVDVARQIVLRLLTARARTRAELQTALRKRGVPDEAADEVLNRFTELRLIDDRQFAEGWVEGGQRRMRSRRVLREELRTRGVDADLIDDALADVGEEEDYAAALAFARRKAAASGRLEPQVRYRRLVGALARRGFGGSVSHRAAREALAEGDGGGGGHRRDGSVDDGDAPDPADA